MKSLLCLLELYCVNLNKEREASSCILGQNNITVHNFRFVRDCVLEISCLQTHTYTQGTWIWKLANKQINYQLSDRSSISLSDLPINPPAPVKSASRLRLDYEPPLSTPPSPFLTREIYLKCHKEGMEQVDNNVSNCCLHTHV